MTREAQQSGPAELLIARARKGDQRAFESLYRAEVGRVHGLCLRMTRDAALAEDCTQQVFIRAWRALADFELRSSFTTWLHRIAVNVVLAHRRVRGEEEWVELTGENNPEAAWFDSPVEVAELEAAIQTLPEGARDVVVLAGIYGYSHGEVASMLGVAEGTCKAQLHRARRLLRERLGMEVAT